MLEHMGIRWGYTFLYTASHLSSKDIYDLMEQATEMYLTREEERVVNGRGYEGRLCTQGKYELLGTFGGVRFDAVLETNKGRLCRNPIR